MARTFKYTYGYEPYETLPPVSAEDNGKVLGVSNGSYALVNGGGGGGTSGMAVDLLIGEDNVPYLDCPSNELFQAISAGTNVAVIFSINSPFISVLEIVNASKSPQEGSTLHNDLYAFNLIQVSQGDANAYDLQVIRFEGFDSDSPVALINNPDPEPDTPTT